MGFLAKHGKKRFNISFYDWEFAAFFLDFIHRKKFYARVSGSINRKGMLEFSIIGSPENVKMTIYKIRKLYHRANRKFEEIDDFEQIGREIDEEDEAESKKDDLDLDIEDFNLKSKKF